MLSFVRHVRAEVSADDAVPRGAMLLVELLLDVLRDFLELNLRQARLSCTSN